MLLYAKEVNIKMNRIREIRENKKLSLKKTTELLKSNDLLTLTPDALAKYERGDRQPNEATWQALANFFNVSVDYLKGYGYSKDYIYKQLDDAYKEKWKDPTGQIMGGSFDKTVDAYLKQAKIKKPSNMNKEFWRDNFNFLFDTPNIKRLLTTKDKYSDNDIKLVLEYTIFLNFTGMKQIIDYYNNK